MDGKAQADADRLALRIAQQPDAEIRPTPTATLRQRRHLTGGDASNPVWNGLTAKLEQDCSPSWRRLLLAAVDAELSARSMQHVLDVLPKPGWTGVAVRQHEGPAWMPTATTLRSSPIVRDEMDGHVGIRSRFRHVLDTVEIASAGACA